MHGRNEYDRVPEVDLASYKIDAKLLNLIPASVVRKHNLIPLFKVGDTLTIAMADPKNISALDEVRSVTKMDLSVVKAALNDIQDAITEFYGISGAVDTVIQDYVPPTGKRAKLDVAAEAPIMKLVDVIISQAIRERASDIHIEPEAKDLRVRYRVDGVLHEELSLPKHMHAPVISRIKILGNMNIAESRVPQDGRFEVDQEGKKVDLRLSSFPSSYGEKMVLRILDKSAMLYELAEIGFSKENLKKFSAVIRKPHGIVLVTGPTGSGKTTTLYAALSVVNNEELNMVTVEDPIEYELPGVTQAQVNVKAGLTFASALRSILRQDPDIIFIGEIRDIETASIAIQSAMTGHLVFSSLHTNDAPGALTRLIDMGVEPFLISSSVEAVLAQRLVRKICDKCVEKIPAPAPVKQKYPEIKTVNHGKGCKACKNTGYRGRVGIFELLIIDEEIRKMITSKVSSDEIRKYAISRGMKTLLEDGMEKVKAGITTIDEVLRVTELEQI
ncbi:MAG: GspE/PulE family protein [Candidatus Margulisbacteria bacterium]|nr:GspE/PulE family protein [Candidatus Margulisiibacteriota bacterium]MBU1022262.1 GspE/PulE family protein [Candidatus Margulisiibacteriota bacterium]MBU1729299.1 GspE/PulE family protein [Candidatus Margulisiibacteriota bacterium]MBU1955572.1 GspE/PulE family protein [Candidatus Margulisiibacteriota bacterium]